MSEYFENATVKLATAMNRRRFLRRMATGTFAGVAALAAGELISTSVAFAYPATCETTTGPGCPYGCGPSWACSVQSGGCHCSNGNGGCQNGTINCQGNYNDWGTGINCWTCVYEGCDNHSRNRYTTTCCDCATTYCDKDHRCIAYNTTVTNIGGCNGASSPYKPGQVIGVATGNPATSWGVQPKLAPVPQGVAPGDYAPATPSSNESPADPRLRAWPRQR